jgi:hypothetical protein
VRLAGTDGGYRAVISDASDIGVFRSKGEIGGFGDIMFVAIGKPSVVLPANLDSQGLVF